MAMLNVRIDDSVRDQLKDLADENGQTVSDYVRDLLMEAVVPIPVDDATPQEVGTEPTPETLPLFERQTLALLHRILGRVLPSEGEQDVDGDLDYQLERARVLEAGFTREYWTEVAGFRTELSSRDCTRVTDILQMFRVITYSVDDLANAGTPIDPDLVRRLEFMGFDHNDALEGHMADYVKYVMGDDRWTELQPQIDRHDGGNSHMPMRETYARMLTEYRRIMDDRARSGSRYDYMLNATELGQIAKARFHPARRS